MDVNALHNEISESAGSSQFSLEAFEEKGCRVLALVFNPTSDEIQKELVDRLKFWLKEKVELIYSIPDENMLGCLTMKDIANNLNTEILYGEKQMA